MSCLYFFFPYMKFIYSYLFIYWLIDWFIHSFIYFLFWHENTILVSKTKENRNCYTVMEINELLIFIYLKEFGFAEDYKSLIIKSHTSNDENCIIRMIASQFSE